MPKYRRLKRSFFGILNASFWRAKHQFKQYKRQKWFMKWTPDGDIDLPHDLNKQKRMF